MGAKVLRDAREFATRHRIAWFGIVPDAAAAPTLSGRRARVLVVDPDPRARRLTLQRLASTAYLVETADSAELALDHCIRSRPNLIVTDLRLPGMDGLAMLRELKSRWPDLVVVIVTAHATIPEAVRATQDGAFSFLVKPVDKEELLGHVARGLAVSTFALAEGDWRARIVSRSRLMEERLGLANRAASCDEPVLLTGENGTGKELFARAIHAAGTRRDRGFVAVRCNEPDTAALEVHLFGHALAAAHGGTLLLDEVDRLPPALQLSLLTVLRQAAAEAPRLICTSTRDLQKCVESGEFRRDLYYHINIMPIEIPPLGRRREDIPLLVSHFLEQAVEPGGESKLYSPDAIELLATTDWPGNVRQLFDLVKQNVALSHGKIMSKEFVERSLGAAAKPVPSYDEAREQFARDYLAHNLQATAGNVSEAARLAKRNRTDFYKLLARYRVAPDDFKKNSGES